MTNIFETATRKAYRFPSARGELTVEQLWELPLIAGTRITRDVKCDLDTIARTINTELKSITEDSFVQTRPDPRKADLETKLEILKHIISVKQSEAQAAADAKAKAEKRAKILEALADREDSDLKSKSRDELLAELKQLDEAS